MTLIPLSKLITDVKNNPAGPDYSMPTDFIKTFLANADATFKNAACNKAGVPTLKDMQDKYGCCGFGPGQSSVPMV